MVIVKNTKQIVDFKLKEKDEMEDPVQDARMSFRRI